MRTSKDIYKLENGKLVAIGCNTRPPANATLWRGYDYDQQYWVFNGEQDRRSVYEIKKSIEHDDTRNNNL